VTGHSIQFHATSILAKKFGYTERIIREAMETELHYDNVNREESLPEQAMEASRSNPKGKKNILSVDK
jgi:hypothetical protein